MMDRRLILDEPEGLLPRGWGAWGRLSINCVAWMAQWMVLARWRKRILDSNEPLAQNRYMIRWLTFFTYVVGLFLLLLVYQFILHFSGRSGYVFTVMLTICLTIVFISLSLLLRPSILYGMTGWMQGAEVRSQLPVQEPVHEQEAAYAEHKRPTLSLSQGLAYKQALESHFTGEKPFLKKGYKISDLSNELDIPYHQLSAFINQEYGKNFNELVNEYRVDHLVKLHEQDPGLKQFTLEALGQKVGFNSRVAFIAAVKKRTGKTPSELFGRREETHR
jgi:AraC-like DNA-binding protein